MAQHKGKLDIYTQDDPALYDGYIAEEGNKEQIDNENIPFIHSTGFLSQNLLPSMVLFMDKGNHIKQAECSGFGSW